MLIILIPVGIASIVLCNKPNNKSSPKTNTHAQEELPVSMFDVSSSISVVTCSLFHISENLGEPINEIQVG